MGIEKAGLQFGKKFIAWTRTSVSKNLLATRPVKVNLKGLQYKGSLTADTCKFMSDRTLCPKFLDNLAADLENLGGDTYKKIEFIRNRMLHGMGYKLSPELLKIKKMDAVFTASFSVDKNTIFYSSEAKLASNKELIALIRHELDHFDKYAKTIKCEGFDNVQHAYSKVLKLDRNFWTNVSNGVEIKDFDSKKYLKAIQTYANPSAYNCKNAFQQLWAQHLYCTNPLEESAYKIEKQINNHFGIQKVIHPDCYGEPVKKLYDIMISKNIDSNMFENAYKIRLICRTQDGLIACKNNDIELANKILKKNLNPSPEELPKIFEDIYKWFKAGKIDFNLI